MTHPALNDKQLREAEIKELLLPLLRDYFRELDRIAEKPPLSDEQYENEAASALAMSANFEWTPVYAATDGSKAKVVGFYAFSRTAPLAELGVYLAEAYIVPSERRKGYMRRAISEYVTSKRITALCYVTQKKNTNALHYWARLFKSLGFTQRNEAYRQPLPDGFALSGWFMPDAPLRTY